jgi:hypothetical protein
MRALGAASPRWTTDALVATKGQLIKSSVCRQVRTDQQDVVVCVYGGHHPR